MGMCNAEELKKALRAALTKTLHERWDNFQANVDRIESASIRGIRTTLPQNYTFTCLGKHGGNTITPGNIAHTRVMFNSLFSLFCNLGAHNHNIEHIL